MIRKEGRSVQGRELRDDFRGLGVLKLQIQQQQVRLMGLEPCQGLRAGAGGGNREAFALQRAGPPAAAAPGHHRQ